MLNEEYGLALPQFPFLRNRVTFFPIGYLVRHNCLSETIGVSYHQHWPAPMMKHVVLQVIAIIGWREIDFYVFLRILALNKFQGRKQIAIGTNQCDSVCLVLDAICHHPDGDIHIRFLLFRSYNITFAEGADNMFLQIFSSDDLKPISIDQFVSVQESTLPAILVTTERRCGEIDDLGQLLSLTKETTQQFHHVDPIESSPLRISLLRPFQTEVEVESIHIKSHTFRYHSIKNKAAQRRLLTMQESMALLVTAANISYSRDLCQFSHNYFCA